MDTKGMTEETAVALGGLDFLALNGPHNPNHLTYATFKTRGKKRRAKRPGRKKGPATTGRLVDLCSRTTAKHVLDFADARLEQIPRPGCNDCYGTGTVGVMHTITDGKTRKVSLACACLFKKKSEANMRFWLASNERLV